MHKQPPVFDNSAANCSFHIFRIYCKNNENHRCSAACTDF